MTGIFGKETVRNTAKHCQLMIKNNREMMVGGVD
jgi:hypothetical protein